MIKSKYNLISADNLSSWMDALCCCGAHDIYHLPQYHFLAKKLGEGDPYLFFFQYKNFFAAIPFLLRPIAEVKGLETFKYNDITSVYGYPGLLTSIDEKNPDSDSFRKRFQEKLMHVFEDLSVVSFFSRTNPLLQTSWLLQGIMEIITLSKTVVIDLEKTNEEQLAEITKGHKYDIRKARKQKVTVIEDKSFENIETFIQIYNGTMQRNRAAENYFFSKDYYIQLKKSFGKSIKLFFAMVEDKPISAAMFFCADKIIQYHLSGSDSDFFPYNGAKLILDEVRLWGSQNGFSWLHLGGGVGSSEDNLFRFKAGFSKTRLPFQVLRMIVNKNIYSDLCDKRKQWAQKNNYILPEKNFFPFYRL